MAQKEPSPDADASQLEQMAFRLFADRSGRGFAKRGADSLVRACYRDAATFLDVARKIRAGELSAADKPAGFQLADASAPNLKPSHPLNMVSRRFGDPSLKKVREIHDRLEKNPTVESLPDLEWGKTEVSIARNVFPDVLKAAAA